ncbi:hypothetical protein QBC42DRAFT_347770 [Cladorrhinum samala]|uniref:F-box domain-containing protein n=1 Tax=Cladorrhinum samala TaxID=585594 RepID=A0AAV9HJ15_9PEZI|nr:hypothetical protein QBC42DRAFT_347770 [Cladorrhinum samala]
MLDQLPLDILFHLTTHHLDFQTAFSLSFTTRALHASLDPRTLCSSETITSFYLQAERYPQNIRAARLTCFRCLELLPLDRFADSQRRGPRGRNGHDARRRSSRFCFDCAAKHKLYAHLRGVKRGGLTWYLCHLCGRWKQKDAADDDDDDDNVNGSKTLGSSRCCWPRSAGDGKPIPRAKGRGAQKVLMRETKCCGGDADGPPNVTAASRQLQEIGPPLGRLPDAILQKILGFCGYGDLVSLKKTSRFFRKRVEPVRDCRSVYSMFCWVMEIWKTGRGTYSRLGRPDWRRPCFGCFRRREDEQFSRAQWTWVCNVKNENFWRARCWECLRRFHCPLGTGDKDALARFRRQEMCIWCGCLKWADEDGCEGCLVNKDMVARRKEVRVGRMMARAEGDLLSEDSESQDLALWFRNVELGDDSPGSGEAGEEPIGGDFGLGGLFEAFEMEEEEEEREVTSGSAEKGSSDVGEDESILLEFQCDILVGWD